MQEPGSRVVCTSPLAGRPRLGGEWSTTMAVCHVLVIVLLRPGHQLQSCAKRFMYHQRCAQFEDGSRGSVVASETRAPSC